MKKYMLGLTLQESLFVGFCSLFILATKMLLRLNLKIPGHAMFFLILFLMLAALCVRKPWAATITGLLSGCIGIALGVGKAGPLFVLGFVLPAVVVDLGVMMFLKSSRNMLLFGLVGFFAAASKIFISVSTDMLVGMDTQVLIMDTIIKTGVGALFGFFGALPVPMIVNKLKVRGLISDSKM